MLKWPLFKECEACDDKLKCIVGRGVNCCEPINKRLNELEEKSIVKRFPGGGAECSLEKLSRKEAKEAYALWRFIGLDVEMPAKYR